MGEWPKFKPSGDMGIIVEYPEEISLEVNDQVRALHEFLGQHTPPGFVESIPSYRALLVLYDPLTVSYREMEGFLREACGQATSLAAKPRQVVEIPTVYGGDFGPDLAEVASHNGLTPEDVIHIHSSTDYPVYMLGFTPGFPYLGGLDRRIACPRRKTPRTKIPAGSVGIAGEQTGIYPLDSPGGWQIIGRTTRQLFCPEQDPPVLLKPGDLVRFVPISL